MNRIPRATQFHVFLIQANSSYCIEKNFVELHLLDNEIVSKTVGIR